MYDNQSISKYYPYSKTMCRRIIDKTNKINGIFINLFNNKYRMATQTGKTGN